METLKNDYHYTYADYASWETEERYELIDGVSYLMSPAPLIGHQDISMKLSAKLFNFLEGKHCKVFQAPVDVCLFAGGDDDDTVVQPDILVVCDLSKLDGRRCNGAPDMIIEILSPTSAKRDLIIKFNKYLQAGVREYWIVNPDNKIISVHILENGKYVTRSYTDTDTIAVNVLNGCEINLNEVFEE